jgi:hypothetical protein
MLPALLRPAMAHWRGDEGWLVLATGYAEHQRKILIPATQRGGIQSLSVNPAARNGMQ